MKKLATIEPYLKEILLVIIVASLCWYYNNKQLSVIMLLLYSINNLLNINKYKKKEEKIEKFTEYIDKSISNNFCNLGMPVALINEFGEIIWHNVRFSDLDKEKTSIGKNITDIARGLNLAKISKDKPSSHQRINYNNVRYDVCCSKVSKDNKRYTLVYFNDITDLVGLDSNKESLRESIMLIEVDNLTEVLEGTYEQDRPLVVAEIERTINAYAQRLRAMIKRYETNKYVLSVQDMFVEEEIKSNFSILDEISTIEKGNKLELTLSIGIGRGGISPHENNSFATLAKELALGRGGDQVVIKNNDEIKFFGGNTKEIEKRTRVRARVVAHALKELIYESSKVYIVGHSNPDMDCFGSAVALSSVIKQLGKRCNIILNNDTNAIEYFLGNLKKNDKYVTTFISSERAYKEFDDETLVIVVDVHNRSYVGNLDLVDKAKRKVIIDHHRRSADIIQGTMLNYIEVYASSTSEMITEMIQYMIEKPKLSKEEANGLLAGIFMDTKSFSFKTGVRTFEAASFLRQEGADTIEVKKMFTDTLDDYLVIAETIKSAEVDYDKKTAIAVCPDQVDTVIIAKSADELLNISGISACFVLANIDGDIYISGRSVGDINVQVVLEALGGGGHMNIAGAKLDNTTKEDVIIILKEAMSKYLRVGE